MKATRTEIIAGIPCNIFDIFAQAKARKDKAVSELVKVIDRLPIETVNALTKAITQSHCPVGLCEIMRAFDVHVRVAVWEMRHNRCWHAIDGDRTLYEVGSVQRAKIDKLQGGRWVEAWIA